MKTPVGGRFQMLEILIVSNINSRISWECRGTSKDSRSGGIQVDHSTAALRTTPVAEPMAWIPLPVGKQS